MEKADDAAHTPALGKFPFPSQTEGAEGIDNVADSACHCSQENQVDRINKVGQKLDSEQVPVAFALVGKKEQ